MIGTKIMKPITDRKAYADVAIWCNSGNNATIVDQGDYYEVVAIEEEKSSEGTENTEAS